MSCTEEAVEDAIKVAVDGRMEGPVLWHQFEVAMRNFARDQDAVAGLIPDHTLMRKLAMYPLEVMGVDLATTITILPETATVAQYLEQLAGPHPIPFMSVNVRCCFASSKAVIGMLMISCSPTTMT